MTSPLLPLEPPGYAERLWSGSLGWVAVVVFAMFSGLALYPVNPTVAAVAGAIVLATGTLVSILTAPRVEVAGGELRAGEAHIPLDLVGEVRELTAEQTAVELGPALDARAYLCLRQAARTSVRIEILDDADPTPYWLISTRRPHDLARAVTLGRDAAASGDKQPGRPERAARPTD